MLFRFKQHEAVLKMENTSLKESTSGLVMSLALDNVREVKKDRLEKYHDKTEDLHASLVEKDAMLTLRRRLNRKDSSLFKALSWLSYLPHLHC